MKQPSALPCTTCGLNAPTRGPALPRGRQGSQAAQATLTALEGYLSYEAKQTFATYEITT